MFSEAFWSHQNRQPLLTTELQCKLDSFTGRIAPHAHASMSSAGISVRDRYRKSVAVSHEMLLIIPPTCELV